MQAVWVDSSELAAACNGPKVLGLNPSALAVALVVHVRVGGKTRPPATVREVCQWTGYNRKTVGRALRDLERAGILKQA